MTITVPSFTPDQFLRPLDVIRSEHDRQVVVCDRIEKLAIDRQLEPVLEEAEMLLTYLTKDLPLHCKDEEDDLFGMLRRRCRPGDTIDGILAELDRDHATERFLACSIVVDLKPIVGRTLDDPWRFFDDLRIFAEGQRRHVAWENRAVLPLALKRLCPEDLEEMGRNMTARRGIPYPRNAMEDDSRDAPSH